MLARWCAAALFALVGCGERVIELDPGRAIDGGPPDGGPPDGAPCVAGDTECTNCADDDGDGEIDGFDIECTGGADDDEASFDTAIPGDNQDVTSVDCFFDGNSGSGNDGCNLHVCCVLDECPPGLPGPTFDPGMCTASAECIDNCGPLVPPGCDCLGCCTICDGADCEDIYLSPALAPDCDADSLGDPVACPRCHPLPDCGQPCGGTTCILCPGQVEADLPGSCTGAVCPDDEPPCENTTKCGAGRFCAAGCCIAAIP